METLSYIVMGFGAFIMFIGVIGLFKPKRDFYYRILVACKIDTVGLITLGIGVSIYHGFSFFTGKVVLIVIIILILNPFVAHITAKAAFLSGLTSEYTVGEKDADNLSKNEGKLNISLQRGESED